MSRIPDAFARTKAAGRAAFMPFLTAGDPDLETTARLIPAMAKAGADLIEVGVPFSDPLADGPTIQASYERALAQGASLRDVIGLVRTVRNETDVPLLLMGSYNPIFIYGVEAFCRDAADAGADGLIVPDLLPDHADELVAPARAAGLETVFLIAPTSTDERIRRVAGTATGFVYVVSLAGVTGERTSLPPALSGLLARARAETELPLAVGFGVSTPGMAKSVGAEADGVIIGSAVVKRIAAAAEAGDDPVPSVAAFVREVAEALGAPAQPRA